MADASAARGRRPDELNPGVAASIKGTVPRREPRRDLWLAAAFGLPQPGCDRHASRMQHSDTPSCRLSLRSLADRNSDTNTDGDTNTGSYADSVAKPARGGRPGLPERT